ncbi:MAG: tRNA pseudouridine(38-40) synthase TruA [Clostridiales bacterium]|nr:tRNA pseudouridine(38-40) synthase TruA [Clostridiales bacterium]
MIRYAITISYDGGGFCGWQHQANCDSVQDAVEKAIFLLSGERVKVVGSGRTDAGVHALGQVASFSLEKDLAENVIVGGLNAHLPKSIRILSAKKTEESFDARKSAKKKTYMYLMYRGNALPVLYNRALCVGDVNVEAMRAAAKDIVGTHDFSTFKAAGSGAKTSVRTVYDVRIDDDGKFIKLFITANGFLYNMVRIIAAQLVKIGSGAKVDIKELIEKRDRTAAKETAPAFALYLYSVEYND